MNSLGQLMLEHAWITDSQLDRAIERQQQFGGRLGTCFLELGFVTEDVLLQALAQQLKAPVATAGDLAEIAPEALALLPKETAVRSRAVPFRVTGKTVDIAMLDVGDLALEDELSFMVGKRVRFHIAVELRLVEALARYYGGTIPVRLATLAQQLSAAGKAEARTDAARRPRANQLQYDRPEAPRRTPSPTPSLIPRQERQSPTSIPLTEEERAALVEVRKRVGADETGPEEAFTTELLRAETFSDIGKALLRALSEQFVRTLLFRITGTRQEVTGWLADGPDIDDNWFENYSVGLDKESVFREVLASRDLFVGRLEAHPGHDALARCWGSSLEHECVLLPIFVRGRLVCVVYADRSSLGLDDLDQSLIRRLGNKAGIAFERCILRRKLQSA